MNEELANPEVHHVTRASVAQEFKKFSLQGILHPDHLDQTNPSVIHAENLLAGWVAQEEQKIARDKKPHGDLEFNFERTTLMIDAGFSDPDYLDEVAHDFLANDLSEAEGADADELVSKIRTKIEEIEQQLEV